MSDVEFDDIEDDISVDSNESGQGSSSESEDENEESEEYADTQLIEAPSNNTEEVICRTGQSRRSSNVMTKFEFSKLIGARATQLNTGAPPYIELTSIHTTSIIIAYHELLEKKCTFFIKRKIGDIYEIWNPNEMVIPNYGVLLK